MQWMWSDKSRKGALTDLSMCLIMKGNSRGREEKRHYLTEL